MLLPDVITGIQNTLFCQKNGIHSERTQILHVSSPPPKPPRRATGSRLAGSARAVSTPSGQRDVFVPSTSGKRHTKHLLAFVIHLSRWLMNCGCGRSSRGQTGIQFRYHLQNWKPRKLVRIVGLPVKIQTGYFPNKIQKGYWAYFCQTLNVFYELVAHKPRSDRTRSSVPLNCFHWSFAENWRKIKAKNKETCRNKWHGRQKTSNITSNCLFLFRHNNTTIKYHVCYDISL
jgi:hypothetical protein